MWVALYCLVETQLFSCKPKFRRANLVFGVKKQLEGDYCLPIPLNMWKSLDFALGDIFFTSHNPLHKWVQFVTIQHRFADENSVHEQAKYCRSSTRKISFSMSNLWPIHAYVIYNISPLLMIFSVSLHRYECILLNFTFCGYCFLVFLAQHLNTAKSLVRFR